MQIGRKTTVDVAQAVAAYFVPWHNAQALWRRQYVHLIVVMELWKLSNGPINLKYTPEPEDPMDLILDMLYPDVGPDVTKEELDEMPPPNPQDGGRQVRTIAAAAYSPPSYPA